MFFDGTKLNPDAAMVRRIKKQIKSFNGFCPTKKEKTPDCKCPCREYRETGYCSCGLYVKDVSALTDEMFSIFQGAQ